MGSQQGYRTKTGMGSLEGICHGIMLIGTLGMWYPVYKMRKNYLNRRSTTYAVGGAR